jgi:cullin-associated NEDD8-dissociated protein 1
MIKTHLSLCLVSELVRSTVVYAEDASSRTDAELSAFGPSAFDTRTGKASIRPNASVLVNALPNVVTALCRQLRSKSVKTRGGVLSLVKVISQASMPKLSEELVKVLKDSSSPSSMKLDTLVVYHLQLQSFKDAQVYQAIAPSVLPLLLKAIDDTYYKISAQALRVLGAYVYVLRPGILSRSTAVAAPVNVNMVPVFDAVRGKLVAAEVDQEVKECALLAFGG